MSLSRCRAHLLSLIISAPNCSFIKQSVCNGAITKSALPVKSCA
jgi:hypothetical protein